MERFVISTGAFAEADRAEAFRETFGRSILRIEIEPLGDQRFESEMVIQSLPGLMVASGSASPVHCRHAGNLIDNDDIILSVLDAGRSVFNQHGRASDVRAGDVVLTANGEPATFTHMEPLRTLNLRLSRARILPKLADLGSVFRAPVLRDGPALRLLKSYTRVIRAGDHLADPALAHAVSTHLYDLAAIALGANHDATALARGRGVRAARLHAVKTAVLDRLTTRPLAIDLVARQLGVSPSYIRQLFAGEGTTFTDFVLDQRLRRAHMMLASPAHSERSVSQIAFDCGFGDLSYFNRCFRRRYGITPSDVRVR